MSDAIVSAAGIRLIKLLVGREPRTVLDLMEEVGVTRTAITEQLHELMRVGYVERIIEHLDGRGRPRHRYSVTPAAQILLFAANQQLVVPAIWRAIRQVGGVKLTRTVLRRVIASLLKHYRDKVTATDPKQRLEQYVRVLRQEGALIHVSADGGQITITKRSCPFINMFEDERNVCAIDRRLMAKIAGCPIRQVSNRHDGDPCCEFEADAEAAPKRKKTGAK